MATEFSIYFLTQSRLRKLCKHMPSCNHEQLYQSQLNLVWHVLKHLPEPGAELVPGLCNAQKHHRIADHLFVSLKGI